MSLSATLTIQGPFDEVQQAAARIGPLAVDPKVVMEQEPETVGEEAMDRLLAEVTPDARVILRVIADHAPEVSFDTIQEEVGPKIGYGGRIGGIPLSGKLASVGFAVRRVKVPSPIVRDYRRRHYLIDPAVAKVVKGRFDAKYDRQGVPRRTR